ncbi:myb-like protein P [Lucilia cuprina]|uniref:myb-like protein P n=1 Tax=Lucilia cuprina TaxID=7375 RepID=UPI001F070D70|nr:myb-like protein P [Lucilia cuprina]
MNSFLTSRYQYFEGFTVNTRPFDDYSTNNNNNNNNNNNHESNPSQTNGNPVDNSTTSAAARSPLVDVCVGDVRCTVRALIDSVSEATFISKNLQASLTIPTKTCYETSSWARRNEQILSTETNVKPTNEALLELDSTLSQSVFEFVNQIPICQEEQLEIVEQQESENFLEDLNNFNDIEMDGFL